MKELQSSFDGRISKLNSTSTVLAWGWVFTWTAENIVDVWVIVISVIASHISAINWLSVQFSSDWTNWDITDVFTIPATTGKTFSFQPAWKFFRVVYTNGATLQTYFRLQTLLKATYVKPSSHKIQDAISTDDDAELTKSVLTGKDPSWIFRNINTNAFWNLLVSLSEQKDAFGRLRVSEPYTVFDNSLTSSFCDNIFWSTLTNGTGSWAYTQTTSKYTLSTTTDWDYVVRQTKQRFKYQPWKSHQILMTWLFTTETGQIKRIWLFDHDDIGLTTITNAPQNWVYFENNAWTLTFNIVNNGTVTESVAQANWNIDKLDWTWSSWFTFNVSWTNILFIDMEWLWVWAVRCWFVSNTGEIVVAHQFRHASNWFTDVYMRTANLPLSYSITSTVWAWSMSQICSTVMSEWWFNPKGSYRSIYNRTVNQIASSWIETLLGIRLKEDWFEYMTDITDISVLATSAWSWHWMLLFNPTYTGASTFTDILDSALQQSVTAGLPITNEWYVLASWFFSSKTDQASSDIQNALRLWKSLASVRDEIRLCVFNTSWWNESYVGSIWVREYL